MTEFRSDKFSWEVRQGDALSVLAGMDADSIDCVMTSPPYWSLRSYPDEVAIVWGGESDCEHAWGETVHRGRVGWEATPEGQKQFKAATTEAYQSDSQFCQKCGAWHGQLGLELHPSLYLEHLWQIFDEVKRVLKPTGTCFVNMGDTYGSQGGDLNKRSSEQINTGQATVVEQNGMRGGVRKCPEDDNWLKPKNLLMIPARFAIGMQERGWWLRNDICWHKPNAMPSSVKDRFSCSWEHIFFFAKAARYWFDLDAVREPVKYPDRTYAPADNHKTQELSEQGNRTTGGLHDGRETYAHALGRNPGDCWIIPTCPFPEAHFAVYPEALIVKPIRAGCPPKCCVECGAPWQRIVEEERERTDVDSATIKGQARASGVGQYRPNTRETGGLGGQTTRKTIGWQPTCECGGETEAGTTLDPFAGAGTTGVVCIEEDRNYIGIELSEEYCEM